MPNSRSTYAWWILIGIAALVGSLVLVGWLTVRRSFPAYDGTVDIRGLDSVVEVYRDERGVPHIYASTEHDLFMAQGYVHAQDRFWQMDFNRHVGAGSLAEMFGAAQLGTDRFLKTLGWERVAEQEAQLLDHETLAVLEAYAEGVNAYLESRSGSQLSLEYSILGFLSPDYVVEPWDPVDTLVWAKAMAWDLGGNMDAEIDRSMLMDDLTIEQLNELYPPYPADHPVIVTDTGPGATTACQLNPQLAGSPAFRRSLASVEFGRTAAISVLGKSLPDLGSNSWVVTGSRTASGNAYLANDTHLGIQMPSIWYENGLHCRAGSSGCRFNVAGFSFAGAPGVIIGHNDSIAWGVTNLGPDVQDLYVERLNPENPDQYERDGEWVDMEIITDQIEVAGGEPVPLEVRYTVHGPIIGDSYGPLEAFETESGMRLPEQFAISLRWTALEPSTIFQSVIQLNLASDWNEFREALSYWDVPSQNFVYADRGGSIGYQTPGQIPIRGLSPGCLPMPGWDSNYDWQGFIPFGQLPSTLNPPEEYIVTANHAVVGDQYPFPLSPGWDYGFRANRIVEMIRRSPAIGLAEMKSMQGDNFNSAAESIVPVMLGSLEQELTQAGLYELLDRWDHQDHMDSSASALFNVFWRNLVLRTFGDELGDGPLPQSSRAFLILSNLSDDPDNPWWDDTGTPTREDMHSVYRLAFSDALAELQDRLGRNPDRWRWGDLHTATFRNQSLGSSGVAPIEALFNRGPYAASGGASIVNATAWSYHRGYEVVALPSERLIVDLSDLDQSLAIHTTGQSGHAFHRHYADMIDAWRQIEYFPLPWEQATLDEQARYRLTLEPEG